MERSHTHRSEEHGTANEALADIALNSLGLILIVLFILILSKTTQINQSHGATTISPTAVANIEIVRDENRRLKREIGEMKLAAKKGLEQDENVSGLWRFRIAVNRFIDHRDVGHPAELQIEYFMHLDTKGSQVRGTLFGVKEDPDSNEQGSATHAIVSGTLEGGNMKIELFFTGAALGGSEILEVMLEGDRLIGKLLSGKHKYGYQNYAGAAEGTRLVGSVFSDDNRSHPRAIKN